MRLDPDELVRTITGIHSNVYSAVDIALRQQETGLPPDQDVQERVAQGFIRMSAPLGQMLAAMDDMEGTAATAAVFNRLPRESLEYAAMSIMFSIKALERENR